MIEAQNTKTPITDAACEEIRRVLAQLETEGVTGGRLVLSINRKGVRVESVVLRCIRGVMNLRPKGHTAIDFPL